MNHKQLQQKLHGYRAGSGPTGDPATDAAVDQAQKDPDMQSFLEEEARFDAAFAAKVQNITVPADLKERILRAADIRATQRNTVPFPAAEAHPAPQGSTAASPREAREQAEPRRRSSWLHAGALAFAALVIIGLALNFTFSGKVAPQPGAPASAEFADLTGPFRDLVSQIGNFSPQPANLTRGNGYDELSAILAETGAPVPQTLPRNLSPDRGVACGALVIDGVRVGMVCFRHDDGTFHLFSFDRDAVPDVEAIDEPRVFEQNGRAFATWTDSDQVYVLSGQTTAARIREML